MTVQVVTILDNKTAHFHTAVLQRHHPFLGCRLDCLPHHFVHRVVCPEDFILLNAWGSLFRDSMEFVVDSTLQMAGFSPIFPDTCYHLTHYWPAAVDIPVANDNPVHYADPFVIMLERFCKVLCCREPVWFEHDTDVVTLYRFH